MTAAMDFLTDHNGQPIGRVTSRPIPHPYQITAIANARGLIRDGIRSVVLVAPCGAGKTTIAAEIIDSAFHRGKSVLFIANREELVNQASARLSQYGIHHGIIKAGRRPSPGNRVQVASIQTLIRRTLPPADLIFVDECHGAASESYAKVLGAYPKATILGLTATPWRLDGKGLGDVFDGMIVVCQPRELIDCPHPMLVEPRVFAPSVPKVKGIAIRGGDYDQVAIQELMATRAAVEEIINTWQARAAHLQTVVFASGVEHSRMIQEAFKAIGIPAEHLDANTAGHERTRIITGLANGTIQVVTNCGILIAGWDAPKMSCAILARPTQSLTLYLQQVGRVLRVAPGKSTAIVLDHAGCTEMHGYATDDREWTLAGRQTKPGGAPVKTCPKCYASLPSATQVCPVCGNVFAPPEAGEEEDDEPLDARELVEITPTLLRERAARIYDRVKAAGGDLYVQGRAIVYAGPPGVWRQENGDQLRLFLIKLIPPENVATTMTGNDRWLMDHQVFGREHTTAERQALYDALAARCIEHGLKSGWIAHKVRLITGKWPNHTVMNASPYAEAMARKKAKEKETA
jgi:superfamily II DNA or RNA helicase